ncbi:hypothetical protein V8F06_009548 [Rhypophila decipiens]
MLEYYYEDIPTAAHTTPPPTPNNDSSPPVTDAIMELEEEQPTLPVDHPDYEHYKYSKWANQLVVFCLVDIVVTTVLYIATFGAANAKIVELLVPRAEIFEWLPATKFLTLEILILFYILAPSPRPQRSPESRPDSSWQQAYHRFSFGLRLPMPWILLSVFLVTFLTSPIVITILISICAGSYFLLSGLICFSQKRVSQVVAA